jgi:hypothetical protein
MAEENVGYVNYDALEDFTVCCKHFGFEEEDVTPYFIKNRFMSTINTVDNSMMQYLKTSSGEDRDKERVRLLQRFRVIADKSQNYELKNFHHEVFLMLEEIMILRGYLQEFTNMAALAIHHNTQLSERNEKLKEDLTLRDIRRATRGDIMKKMAEPMVKVKEPEEAEEPEEKEEVKEESKPVEVKVPLVEKPVLSEEDIIKLGEKMCDFIEKSMPGGTTFRKILKKMKISAQDFKIVKDKLIEEGKIEKKGTQFSIVR